MHQPCIVKNREIKIVLKIIVKPSGLSTLGVAYYKEELQNPPDVMVNRYFSCYLV